MADVAAPVRSPYDAIRRTARISAVSLYICALAWAPFPLGGAIPWAAGLQEILIGLCWLLWTISAVGSTPDLSLTRPSLAVPLGLMLLVLAWACVQMWPGVPARWIHPAWTMAADALGHPLPGTISLNPWRTEAEVLKLGSYLMAGCLAFRLGRAPQTARLIFTSVWVIGALYVLYAFGLALSGIRQTELFYAVPPRNLLFSGPFMLHNSFATWSGLAALTAVVALFSGGSGTIVTERGIQRAVATVIQYCFGHGAPRLVALLLCIAGVIASASRAGFVATMCGFSALALGALLMVRRKSSRLWAGLAALVTALPLLILVVANGEALASRLSELLDAGTADAVRLALWASAERMIADAPLLGLGLGTFQDAYPLYAAELFSFVMDKAHCDYLEFAAGIGMPAAVAWWIAIGWLAILCLRGLRIRHRNRGYPLAAFGAVVLVALHSAVDFSLQLPAVSLLFATLLGVGTAQAFPTRIIPGH